MFLREMVVPRTILTIMAVCGGRAGSIKDTLYQAATETTKIFATPIARPQAVLTNVS